MLKRSEPCGGARLLEDADKFDAAFSATPPEAEIIDPQQRLLLECAARRWNAAGTIRHRYSGLIGVYAGASTMAT